MAPQGRDDRAPIFVRFYRASPALAIVSLQGDVGMIESFSCLGCRLFFSPLGAMLGHSLAWFRRHRRSGGGRRVSNESDLEREGIPRFSIMLLQPQLSRPRKTNPATLGSIIPRQNSIVSARDSTGKWSGITSATLRTIIFSPVSTLLLEQHGLATLRTIVFSPATTILLAQHGRTTLRNSDSSAVSTLLPYQSF